MVRQYKRTSEPTHERRCVKVIKKKQNPRRRPATQADVNRARDQAVADAVHLCMTVFFTVLLDKEGADKEILHRVWDEVNDLSDSINQGYVTEADLRRVLREEYDIYIE